MEPDKRQLETLHQQASALYLQGEYVGALQAWSELLKIDPEDERAREGARLCQLLVQEHGGPVPGSGAVPPAGSSPQSPASSTAVGFGFGEDLDEELEELDEVLGGGKDNDWMAGESAAAPAQPVEEALDFDLADVPKPPQAAPGATGSADEFEFNIDATDQQATADAVDSAFDFTTERDPGQVQPETPAQPSEARSPQAPAHPPDNTGSRAAEELQNRTNELMAEALEHYEQGDREAALGALSRLEILDDENEAGKTFAAHIRAEMADTPVEETPEVSAELPFEPADGTEPSAVPAVTDAISGTQPALSSVGSEMTHPPMDLGADAAGAPEPGVGDLFSPGPEGLSEFEIPETDPLEEDPLLTDEPVTPVALTRPTSPPSKWLLITAGILVLVGGTFVALQFFGGGPSTDATDSTQLAALPPLAQNDPSPEPGATIDPQQTDGPAPPPAAVDPEAIDRVMDRGDAEFEAGDFAAAVLAYNEAFTLDPQNEVAKRRLQEAGDLFREEQSLLEQRSAAIQAFNDGDFRNALRIFYRIPPVDEAERARFMRYRLNGWYNMGLRALKSGDCRLARSHLKEARSIDALDPGLRGAMDLTSLCFEGNTQSYFDTVGGLNFRGLDD